MPFLRATPCRCYCYEFRQVPLWNSSISNSDELNGYQSKVIDGLIQLTPREKLILKLICKEYTSGEIAEQLRISPHTVDTHRKNLIHKTSSKNIAGLLNFAYTAGINV